MPPAETERRAIFKDAHGNEHQYQTYLINGWEGLPLFGRIQDAAIGLFAHGAEGIGFGGGKGSILDREIKGDAIVEALRPAINLLCQERDFVLALFAHTIRDGMPLNGSGAFGVAYQGNYGEFYAATIWIIKENFLDPLVASLNELLGTDLVMKATELFERFSSDPASTG